MHGLIYNVTPPSGEHVYTYSVTITASAPGFLFANGILGEKNHFGERGIVRVGKYRQVLRKLCNVFRKLGNDMKVIRLCQNDP